MAELTRLPDALVGVGLSVPVLVSAGLAGAAVAVLLPRPGAGRLRSLHRRRQDDGGSRALTSRLIRPAQGAGTASGVLVAACVALALWGVAAGVLAALAAVSASRWRSGRTVSAAREAERGAAVEACAALAAELRAGRAPAQALEIAAGLAVGPSRDALAAASVTAGLGGDVAVALLRGADTGAVGGVLRSLAACWAVCAGSGSGLAAAVERLEQGLRAERDQRRAVQSELAGPRATAGMLAVLPVGGLVLAAGLGADPVQVLLHTPVGLVCLTTGLGLDVLGLAWTSRLVARAEGAS